MKEEVMRALVVAGYFKPHPPCPTCPFRTDSIRGYFGPYDAAHYWRAAHSDTVVQCHTTTPLPAKHHRHCTGVALHRHITVKRMHDPVQAAHQAQCLKKYGVKGILSWDFKQHHHMEDT